MVPLRVGASTRYLEAPTRHLAMVPAEGGGAESVDPPPRAEELGAQILEDLGAEVLRRWEVSAAAFSSSCRGGRWEVG
jgi:hypothetical protein